MVLSLGYLLLIYHVLRVRFGARIILVNDILNNFGEGEAKASKV